jgi:hypothetical protein
MKLVNQKPLSGKREISLVWAVSLEAVGEVVGGGQAILLSKE